ncbi:MAG: cell surface protein [Verrucomicrobiota bacterium]
MASLLVGASLVHAAPPPAACAPTALAIGADARQLFVACAETDQILVLDPTRSTVSRSIRLNGTPSGLALSPDGKRLIVTCAAPESSVIIFEAASGKLLAHFRSGHTACAPVVSPDGTTLFVCDRFDNDVAAFNLADGREVTRIPVLREPVAMALTPDGRRLLVANHLPTGRADASLVAAAVSVMDTTSRRVVTNLALPNGCGLLRGIAISADGRFAAVTHQVAHNYLPTTQLDRGWMNSNALTLFDLTQDAILGTVLLDELDRGAANPWAVAWSADGRRLLITHAGTHELSVIDAPALIAKLARPGVAQVSAEDLAFLVGLRQRVALPVNGPRALVVSGHRAFVAGYFSGDLATVDFDQPPPVVTRIPLSSGTPLALVRRGEMLFSDGRLCFQEWQSCASCHSADGRVDGLNWDLLNDGIGNPKNTHSLLLSHRTPPAMSQGVRETAEPAVRAGLRHILFSAQPEDVAVALDDYLRSLQPIASPHLQHGQLSAAARRGKRLFHDVRTGCASCHPPPLFTSLKSYDVGTRAAFDDVSEFDTPSLIELWRTAPYLHDGSAATVTDVLTTRNPHNRHGYTAQLTPAQIADLAAYLLSL